MVEPDLDLVHAIGEYLREFKLRLGPNTVESIARGMRDVYLSGGERRELAEYVAPLVEELADRRRPADDDQRAYLAELLAATRAYAAEHDPHIEIQEELAAAWTAAAGLLPEGPEKARLRQAVGAAKELLGPRKDDGDDVREETT